MSAALDLDGVRASTVVRPKSIDELSEALRDAHERGLRVSPFGGGTHFEIGHQLERIDVAIDMRMLTAVVQYEPDDMTISVQAGMTASELQALLSQRGRRLPLDVADPTRATIGGMTAVGHAGSRRFGHGGLRDVLIGARAVLADGTIVHTGGMVVKNVAGYDLTKLLHGSLGSLGVIAELNFRISTQPPCSVAAAYRLADGATAVDAARELMDTRLPYAAVEAGSDGALVVACEGHTADVSRLRARADAAAAQRGGSAAVECTGQIETDRFWSGRLQAPFAERTITFRLALLPDQLASASAAVDVAARDASFAPSWRADAGCGTLEFSVDAGESQRSISRLDRSIADAYSGARIVRCPPSLRTGLHVFGRTPQGLPLMRTLKSLFDPHGVLNVGRNVGGL